MTANSKKNKDNIEEILQKIIQLVKSANLEELEIREGKRRIRLKRRILKPIEESEELLITPDEIPQEEKREEIKVEDKYEKVVSPLTGIFYRASTPNDEPYVKEGDIVEKGATLAVIEAMKLFNEIKSEITGKIIKIMAKNGEHVNEGQILFLIEPTEKIK